IEYACNNIRCLNLSSLQRAHYRVLDIGNGRDSRIRPVSSSPGVVDIPAPTSPRAQDRPIKGSYKRDSFRIPSINAQYALHTQPPDSYVGIIARGVRTRLCTLTKSSEHPWGPINRNTFQ